MPRHESVLKICEKDIDSLNALANKLDNEACIRAKIILAFQEETRSSNIAEALDVSVDTVRKWKKAYMENGISGLYPSVKQRTSTIELKDRIQLLMSEHDSANPLTVHAMAKKLGVSKDQVYYALRSMGTSPIRKTNWEISTKDVLMGDGPYLCGLYVKKDVLVLAWIGFEDNSKDGMNGIGQFETRDFDFQKRLGKSAVTLSQNDTFYEWTRFPMHYAAGSGLTPEEFVMRVADAWLPFRECGEHVQIDFFIWSENLPGYKRVSSQNVSYHYDAEYDKWKAQVILAAFNGDLSAYHEVGNLLKSIECYLKTAQSDADPYIWRLTSLALKEDTQSILKQSQGYASLELALEEFMSQASDDIPDNHQACVAILATRNESGKIVCKMVDTPEGIPKGISFDVHSKEGFEKDIADLDESLTRLTTKIGHVSRRFYFEDVKKNPWAL